MSYAVRFRDVATEDLDALSPDVRSRVLRSVENKLGSAPHRFGVRLRRSLAGLWKLRVGDYRVVFELIGSEVSVWAVSHRKDVYREIGRRLERSGRAEGSGPSAAERARPHETYRTHARRRPGRRHSVPVEGRR